MYSNDLDGDRRYKIKDLIRELQKLCRKNQNIWIEFDAGANNVDIVTTDGEPKY